MKRIFLSAFLGIILCLPMVACAAYLACDPSPDDIVQVEIEVTHAGTTTVVPGTYIVVDGTESKLYDLVGVPSGSYAFRARWTDATGWWSEWSESVNAVKPGGPKGFRIKQ